MKHFRVTITPAQGPAWSYVGPFSDGFDAICDALSRTAGQRARISAKVLP